MRTTLTALQDHRIDSIHSQLVHSHAIKVTHALWNALGESEIPENFAYTSTGNIALTIIDIDDQEKRQLIVTV